MSSPIHPFKDFILGPPHQKIQDKTLADFQKDVNDELNKAFATRIRPYDKVQVLLLYWETADSNNFQDLEVLKKFLESEYKYCCEIFKIPGTAYTCHESQNRKPFTAKFHALVLGSTPETLTIIFYSGHGFSSFVNTQTITSRLWSDRKEDLIIFPRAEIMDRPGFGVLECGIDYSDIYGYLTGIDGDVLHLRDCCSGGGAMLDPQPHGAQHEILAASAVLQPGPRSPPSTSSLSGAFCAALIESMRVLRKELISFTSVQLYSYMVTNARNFTIPLDIQPFFYGKFEGRRRPIVLTPLIGIEQAQKLEQKQKQHLSNLRTIKNETKVLLSVTLQEDNTQSIKDLTRWLLSADRPGWVKDISLVAFFPKPHNRGFEMVVTMPVSLWAVLPEHPSYKFVEFVSGDSMLVAGTRGSRGCRAV